MLLEYENLVDPVDPTKIKIKLIKAGIVMEICEKGTIYIKFRMF